MEYRRHRNPKVIALWIEIILLVAGALTLLILDGAGVKMNIIVVAILSGVLIFSLILTLSLIRYDVVRSLRRDGYFANKDNKNVFLNIYTDPTTLMGHDIKDEEMKDKSE